MTRPLGIFLHGIFCEQVRKEASGASNFIGVKLGGIRFRRPPPFILRDLTVVVWVILEGDYSLPRLQLRLDIPGRKSFSYSGDLAPPPIPKKNPSDSAFRRIGTITLYLGRISVATEGDLVLHAIFDEYEEPIAVLKVRQQPTEEQINLGQTVTSTKSTRKKPRVSRKKPASES